MNSASVRQAFRSCTASLSSRAIARSSSHAFHPRSSRFVTGMSMRRYSDKTATEEQSSESKTTEGAEAKENDAIDVSPEAELLAKLTAKEQETVDLTSRLRYLQADFINLQRNAAREKEQQRDFAITRFAGDLLETVDVLALALSSVPQSALTPTESSDSSASTPDTPPKSAQAYLTQLHEGVELTHRLLLSTLFKYHVKPFDPTGEKFDPNRHEALFQAPIPDKEPGTVFDCQKIGYTIKDRLLRAAQVGVVQDA